MNQKDEVYKFVGGHANSVQHEVRLKNTERERETCVRDVEGQLHKERFGNGKK